MTLKKYGGISYCGEGCAEEDLYVTKGWESAQAVRCKKCDQYYYFAFGDGPFCTLILVSDYEQKVKIVKSMLRPKREDNELKKIQQKLKKKFGPLGIDP